MKQLTCEVCGGNDLLKQDGVFVCQSCGCKYSADEVKKLMVQISEPVKVEGIQTLEQGLANAETFMKLNEYKKAEETYKNLSNDYPQDWRCWWGLYNSTKACKGDKISRMFADFSIPNEEYYINAIKLVPADLKDSIISAHDKYWISYYNSVLYDDNNFRICFYGPKPLILEKLEKEAQEYAILCNKIKHKKRLLEELIKEKYDGPVLEFCEIRKHSIQFITLSKDLYDNYVKTRTTVLVDHEIRDVKEILESFDDGGCYVATSVYGSYDCPEVWTLRRYRDYTLAQTWYGRAFIRTYYAISPTLVKWFGNTTWFQNFWKNKLDRMVSNLKNKGFEDKPYID